MEHRRRSEADDRLPQRTGGGAQPAPGSPRGVHLHYTFAGGAQAGAGLSNPLFDLLAAVREGGSIAQAAATLGCSYRFVWGALKGWEREIGQPLVVWSRGHRARLTPFAERLLWTERRARTRMQPHIEALRTSLQHVIDEARDERQQVLGLRASHDLALPVLQQHAAATAALHLDLRFQASADCLRALNDGQCHVAGFQVPALRGAAPVFAKALKPMLRPGVHKLIGCARRDQGLMMRREHAALIRSFPDLARNPLRFVNRQDGSGTRLLIDHLMHEHGLSSARLPGYRDHVEETHVAAAACIASGLADVGVGIEAAALEFGLHFVPLVEEDYFLVCRKSDLAHPAVERLRSVLADDAWSRRLGGVPGYTPATSPGSVLMMTSALPWWRYVRPKGRAPRPAAAAQRAARRKGAVSENA